MSEPPDHAVLTIDQNHVVHTVPRDVGRPAEQRLAVRARTDMAEGSADRGDDPAIEGGFLVLVVLPGDPPHPLADRLAPVAEAFRHGNVVDRQTTRCVAVSINRRAQSATL